ncbi:hypothetical protein COLO4_28523 [Corchorus olitorius]|uniref:Uncharacterized protein n=1 Tax=Corchorus olitorius TaxID=93759 RepID=A0A1R3HK74_9ROSI|nr:hypothetical protein COLO4_28523 [Corchorus olitorius]
MEVDLVDQSGIKVQPSYELMRRQAGGHDGLSYTKDDLKNHLRSKRRRALKYGETGTLLRYFEQQRAENPSFVYLVRMDVEEQITNIFWVDAKMIMDYHQFGGVVSFYTRYKTNREHRPLAVFARLNQHRTTVIFGAALVYDESADSFTMSDASMAKAIPLVMPETYHRLCLFHMMENSFRHLGPKFSEESGLLKELRNCAYVFEEENELFKAWEDTIDRHELTNNNWVNEIYKVKEKWAKSYVKKDIFCWNFIYTD